MRVVTTNGEREAHASQSYEAAELRVVTTSCVDNMGRLGVMRIGGMAGGHDYLSYRGGATLVMRGGVIAGGHDYRNVYMG